MPDEITGLDAAEDEPAPERPVWEWLRAECRGWTAADRRLLWITIGGGLVVNLVTVLVIALDASRA